MPATFSKPTDIPRWADTSGNITEPPAPNKDSGWGIGDDHDSAWENWLMNRLGSWIKWIDERLFDGVDENEFVLNEPDGATAAITLRAANIEFGLPLLGPFEIDDANFNLDVIGTDAQITFDAGGDALVFDRTNNRYEHVIGGTVEARLQAEGFRVTNGLVVGHTGTPVDDIASVGDANFSMEFDSGNSEVVLNFDTGDDRFVFNRTFNSYRFENGGSNWWVLQSSGVNIITGGLVVGSGGSAPVAGEVRVEGGVTGFGFRTVQTFDSYMVGSLAMITDATPAAVNPTAGYVELAQNDFGSFPIALVPGSRVDQIDVRVEQQSGTGVTTLNLYRKAAGSATVSAAATVVATATSLSGLAGSTQVLSFSSLAETPSGSDVYWIGMTTNSDPSGVRIGLVEVNYDQVPNLVVQARGV